MTPPLKETASSAPVREDARDDAPDSRWWAVAGLVVGLAGLGVSQFFAELLSVKDTPLIALARTIAHLAPGSMAQATLEFLAALAQPLVLVLAGLLLLALFVLGGLLWRRSPWAALPVWLGLACAQLVAGLMINGAGVAQVVPVGVGLVIWLGGLTLLAPRLARLDASDEPSEIDARTQVAPSRRSVLRGLGVAGLVAALSGGGTWWLERRRAAVRESRRLLRIPGVTRQRPPAGAEVDLEGVTPWQSANDDFHTVSTALRVPALEASEWSLTIHGSVRNPMVLTYDDLLARGLMEAWVTTSSVMNTVGGPLVDNAWFSGVATRLLLEEAGILDGADVVVQTSADGSERVTALSILTDERPAMLAVAMNGAALQLEHGFPVATVVPGHYEETASCKWVIDWEVTQAATVPEPSGQEGRAGRSPIRLASRIDVPTEDARVPAGVVRFGGVAWHPGVGVEGVEIAVDGGPWTPAFVADVGEDDAWVQWTGRTRLDAGAHTVRVRATNRRGDKQPGVLRDPLPSGASGWHEVSFTVEEPEQG